jgi:hypothetical protein
MGRPESGGGRRVEIATSSIFVLNLLHAYTTGLAIRNFNRKTHWLLPSIEALDRQALFGRSGNHALASQW